jgi:hypothetical protein
MPSAAVGGPFILPPVAEDCACGVEALEVDILLGATSLLGTDQGNTLPVGVETTGESIVTSSLIIVLELNFGGKKLGGGGVVLCAVSKLLQNSFPPLLLD